MLLCDFPLLQLILSLASGRTTVLFEAPQITMALGTFEPPSRAETLAVVDRICAKHHIGGFAVAGHSFGSIPAGWIATAMPWRVGQAIFLDPVCFLLILPDVCYNFLYAPPRGWTSTLFRYAAAREVTVNNALHRHFWWYEVSRESHPMYCCFPLPFDA